jgi:hypothetical protein
MYTPDQRVSVYAATVDARLPTGLQRVTVFDFAPIEPLGGDNEVRCNEVPGAVTAGSGADPIAVIDVTVPSLILWRYPWLLVDKVPAPLTPQDVISLAVRNEPGFRLVTRRDHTQGDPQ